jgi:hypothetical protein
MSDKLTRGAHAWSAPGGRAGVRRRSGERWVGLALVVVATVGAVLAFTGSGPGAPVHDLVGRYGDRLDNSTVSRDKSDSYDGYPVIRSGKLTVNPAIHATPVRRGAPVSPST